VGAIGIGWTESNDFWGVSTAEIMNEYRRLADQSAASARKTGDAASALNSAAAKVSAAFELP
jgi:isoquinoline 1-oxidoreductase subunit beta